MALTKEVIIDKIEIIGEHRIIQVRHATVIKEDGKELSRSLHRHCVSPNDKTDVEDDLVKSLATLLHTTQVKADYAKLIADQEAELQPK